MSTCNCYQCKRWHSIGRRGDSPNCINNDASPSAISTSYDDTDYSTSSSSSSDWGSSSDSGSCSSPSGD